MYLGLLFIYGGLAIFKGNLWTFLLAPAMVAIVRNYVIKREERYLMQAFGDAYAAYSKKVRRWI
jgi:protein-S-isoprenylcysteine O-methyltransferase Ste14